MIYSFDYGSTSRGFKKVMILASEKREKKKKFLPLATLLNLWVVFGVFDAKI